MAQAAAPSEAPYVHVVFFRTKPDAPTGAVESLIADAFALLQAIPSVRTLRVGRPAEQASPDFLKRDYDVGLVIFFDDYAGLETYLVHPLHQQYVAKHLPNLDVGKLGVYDFLHKKNS